MASRQIIPKTMFKKIPFVFFVLVSFASFAQIIIPNGSIALKSGEKYDFVNLRIDGDNVSFNDIATNKDLSYSLMQVKSMEGKALTPEEIAAAEAAHKEAETDRRFRPNYPAGVYNTKEEFIAKTPGETPQLTCQALEGYSVDQRDGQQYCYFRCGANKSKIKNAFAISYNGFLYFQLEAIVKNTSKRDSGQSNDEYNQFVRVIDGGDNYYYLEVELANQWAQAGVYGGLGLIGGSAVNPSLFNLKGVVWDFKKSEFNIFRNCKDFNAFLEAKWPEGVHECTRHYADISKVRLAISQIK
jgi:hypothetical protein